MPSQSFETAVAALAAKFPDLSAPQRLMRGGATDGRATAGGGGVAADQMYVAVPPARLLEVMRFLRDDPRTCFEQLCDLTCVDYLNFPKARDRFGVVYSLLSLTHNHRLWIKCFVNDPKPVAPSVYPIWPGADWMEREVFDMFGIRFEGHPDLRRILTWDGFEAFPLRKDYPLRGRGEREDYRVVTRESA